MKKCLLALALLFAVLLSGCAIVQTTDLADYGQYRRRDLARQRRF